MKLGLNILLRNVVLTTIFLISSLPVKSQDSFWQINAGYKVLKTANFGGTIGIERKFPKHKHFTFALNYSYYDLFSHGATYTDSTGSITIPFTITARYFSMMVNWYPIQHIKQPTSLFYIGAGPTYFDFSYSHRVYSAGPGIRTYIGLQYLFFNRITTGFNFDIIYYYDTLRGVGIIEDGYNLNFMLGYRFNK